MDSIKNKVWIHEFQGLLKETLATLPDEFSLSFSGGIDSSMILFELMQMGKSPKELITFQIQDWETKDLFFSKKIAEYYNIPLKVINIPLVTRQEGVKIVKEIIDIIGLVRKIDIQVCYAYYYMLNHVSTSHLVAGLYEDVIYETNAKLSVMYGNIKKGKATIEELDKIYQRHKRFCYEDKNGNGSIHNHASIRKMIEHYDITLHTPLRDKKIYELFQNIGYEESNMVNGKLKKKWFVIDVMYKDQFEKFGNGKNNSNMHAKKSGNDLNQLHEMIFQPKGGIIKVYNEISKQN